MMVPENAPVLELHGLSKIFQQRAVIKNFSMKAFAGERILLKGNNGSGKTTLLRIMAGLISPDQGLVQFLGQSLNSKNHNQHISWMPVCESGFWARLTGLECLNMYAKLWNISDDQLKQHLNSWKKLPAFSESLNMQTFSLSTGRRQLLHMCRLLMNQPKLILMDEPFRSLDEDNIQFIEEQFRTLAPTSTVIWSSPSELKNVSPSFQSTLWKLEMGAI